MSQTTVKEHPLIFTGESVRAILEGRKTQSRRVMKTTRDLQRRGYGSEPKPAGGNLTYRDGGAWADRALGPLAICPAGKPGDRLWVKEVWTEGYPGTKDRYLYKSTYEGGADHDWHTPIFMPRKAAQVVLEVVSVRVERLQQISEEDCIAEGIQLPVYTRADGTIGPLLNVTASPAPSVFLPENHPWTEADYWRHTFAIAWNRINGKGAWEANPHVWAIAFKRVQP